MDDKKKLNQCEKRETKAGSSRARLKGKILRINGYLTYPSPTLSNCFGCLQGCIKTENNNNKNNHNLIFFFRLPNGSHYPNVCQGFPCLVNLIRVKINIITIKIAIKRKTTVVHKFSVCKKCLQ